MSEAIDWIKPVQTRDGRKVRVLCIDKAGERSVVGLVVHETAGETIYAWYASGNYMSNTHNLDLINVPEKRVAWVNMYPDKNALGVPCKSRDEADKDAAHDREACVRVEYEVGQFDE